MQACPRPVQSLCLVMVTLAGLTLCKPLFAQQSETDDDPDEQALLDDFRSGLKTTVASTAAWLDSFFAEGIDADAYNDAYGSLTLRPEWDEYDGWKVDSSFRAKVILPHAERKLSAIIGRGDFDDFINAQQTTRPTVIRRDQADEEWMVGLGFDPVVHANHNVSFGAGFRGGIDFDPYVRARYRYEGIINERSEIHLQTVGFWRDSDGFGIAQTVEHDFALSERWFNKFWARGTFAERTQGVRWHASEKLYYIYHHERAVGAELWWYGETEHPVPMQDYGLRALHRSRFLRDWLYLEGWVGLHWPREQLNEHRRPRWIVGVEFELLFGQ
ncbi:hypothetical protein J6J08_01500 [Pseudidiomarina sp. 1APR75-33.1]|uniref:hypothetical protein n=1 Tax=Pseudidiomarina terrestris TaxID=2820060 RepID=UPI00264B97B6|nr:hypothetical protein [Pseudidiomarina sp. 1APR75-33.1]MDN7126060.1 hypothetical protein [Pseudidiomarina sp. 1APR75-33.1]